MLQAALQAASHISWQLGSFLQSDVNSNIHIRAGQGLLAASGIWWLSQGRKKWNSRSFIL